MEFLASPVSFQQFAFEHPYIALIYFLFNLLLNLILSFVLFSSLVEIR